ncbi:MAG: hypothetical protein ACXWQR_19245 [Ktedonobacterales bacterium]
MAVAHVRSDTLTGGPYTTLLDSTPERPGAASADLPSNVVTFMRTAEIGSAVVCDLAGKSSPAGSTVAR